MAELKRMYRQQLPAMKLVGKRYHEQDKQNNTFSHKWGEWFANNWFAPLEIKTPDGTAEPFEDCNAYIGLSYCRTGEPYEYWIGVFVPSDFTVPDGYEALELEAGEIVVCWIYGKEPDIYFYCPLAEMKQNGYGWNTGKNGVGICFERYACPRFTAPDKDGNIILDQCYYLYPEE